jgi:hypothetical protein
MFIVGNFLSHSARKLNGENVAGYEALRAGNGGFGSRSVP